MPTDRFGAQATGVGVHPLTRYVMTWVELLAPHRAALELILADGAPAGAAERVARFGGLVARLIEGLERNLEEKSALICADAAGGSASWHLFLANNASFVLNRARDADVAPLLGDDWAARRRTRVDRHAASYGEAVL
jgi:exocyst complex component 7